MPQDVKDWCTEHYNELIFNIYFSDGWNPTKTGINCCYAGIYCLPEDYEPESEFKPHYEEFEIDKDGFFRIKKESYTYYCWFNWQKFLDDNIDKYNNFGGWVYENPISDGKKAELLVTSPHILKRGRGLASCLLNKDEAEPARPTKILFWRYKE